MPNKEWHVIYTLCLLEVETETSSVFRGINFVILKVLGYLTLRFAYIYHELIALYLNFADSITRTHCVLNMVPHLFSCFIQLQSL